MRWWWNRKSEQRSSYTDALTSAFLAAATGSSATAGSTAAVEAASGAISRAFAAATIEGTSPVVTEALGPDVLALIGRNLIRTGDSVHMIDVDDDGMVMLEPVGTWDVTGGASKSTWMYRVDRFGPSSTETRIVPAVGVVHVMYACDPARPWLGIGPLQAATTAARLLAGAEESLCRDTAAAAAYVIPQPATGVADDDGVDALAPLKTAMVNARGKSVFVETTSGAYGGDHRDRPREDWMQKRLGPHPPDSLIKLHAAAAEAVLGAVGIDPVLAGFRAGDGTLAREAYRRFERLVVQPLARIVETELRQKLDSPGLTLKFDSLRASDAAGIARAYKALIESGMSPSAANDILDLEASNA